MKAVNITMYLTQSLISNLKFVLVDAPPKAAEKLFHSATQCTLNTGVDKNTFIKFNLQKAVKGNV